MLCYVMLCSIIYLTLLSVSFNIIGYLLDYIPTVPNYLANHCNITLYQLILFVMFLLDFYLDSTIIPY